MRRNAGEREFFVRKAIGPDTVRRYVREHETERGPCAVLQRCPELIRSAELIPRLR